MPYVLTIPDHLVPTSAKKKASRPKKATAPKKKSKPNAWAAFCQQHMQDKKVQAVPPRERFKLLSQMYKSAT